MAPLARLDIILTHMTITPIPWAIIPIQSRTSRPIRLITPAVVASRRRVARRPRVAHRHVVRVGDARHAEQTLATAVVLVAVWPPCNGL